MKALRLIPAIAVLCFSVSLLAQEAARQDGAVEIAIWGGGGTGLGHSSSAQFADAGVLLGKVLTGPHGPGFLRGDFEYGVNLMPLFLVFQDNPVVTNGVTVKHRETVYGGAVSPLVLKWNFAGGKRVVPFADIEGSAIFTTRNVPAGDTSTVNFGSGLGSGVQFFGNDRHAFSVGGHLIHISNASLGNKNPSYNITLQFRVAYQWWK